MPISVAVTPDGPPNTRGTNWTAQITPSGREFLVGQSTTYLTRRGLHQTPVMSRVPQLFYDRITAIARYGLWAHFIWPSVTAEGKGYHLAINTYDRAAFTFGFYQLAAHTPDDNLVLLFRRLLALPAALDYFPDLQLKNGKVHLKVENGTRNLEVETTVTLSDGKREEQIVGFKTYLNPDGADVGNVEAVNAAKLMDWLLQDRAALRVAEDTAFDIMKTKLKNWANNYGLSGKDPRLAIWVSDIHHQGRGSADEVKAALRLPTLTNQLDALSKVDIYTSMEPNGRFQNRRRTVKRCIAQLHSEGVFAGVTLGDTRLPI
jgi:hypothetical protein